MIEKGLCLLLQNTHIGVLIVDRSEVPPITGALLFRHPF